ncbi:FCS-Like Zinc finger 1-like [Capsicum galapagoense]
MSKRARVNRNDSFDQPNYPNQNISSTDNPNKFLKPSSSFTNNTAATATATASAAVATPASFSSFGMTSNVGGIPNECFFCKKNFKKENHTYIYRSLAFCTEECREVQISFDQNMKKTRMEAANKKGYN